MRYKLEIVQTTAATGHVACQPEDLPSLVEALFFLDNHPFDEYMHKYALSLVMELDTLGFTNLCDQAIARQNGIRMALVLEAGFLSPKFSAMARQADKFLESALANTPMPILKNQLLPDQALHRQYGEIFSKNIDFHVEIPNLVYDPLPPLFFENAPSMLPDDSVSLLELAEHVDWPTGPQRRPAEDTAALALERLEKLNIFQGVEMRHMASLSPIALMRQWKMEVSVKTGRHDYIQSGIQTSYGKGLSLESARASCLMEVVERVSSFASLDEDGPVGCTRKLPLVHAPFSYFSPKTEEAIDPNSLGIEAPYQDEHLYWIQGSASKSSGENAMWAPIQCVYLFCNLDEICLFSGLGSTGLASGNTVKEARLSALMEVMERHIEATTLFDSSRCFIPASDDPLLGAILQDYSNRGISLYMMNMENPLGLPCYKAFVVSANGEIIKGTSAHIDGRRAAISAITETPYQYPYGPTSGAMAGRLPSVRVEDLPNYSNGNADADLAMAETLLHKNGLFPVYVDLTREDLQFPVTKALVPGLAMSNDFDRFYRVDPRLYADYLALSGGLKDKK